MNSPLVKPIYNIFNNSCKNECVCHYLKEMELFLNNEYDKILPKKYLFFKQKIDVYMISHTIVIDFPEKMEIPESIKKYFFSSSFYYTTFFYYANGRSKILIKKCKKGECYI